MMSFGSGSGLGSELGPGLQPGILSNTTEGVTIHQPVDSGASILILESVNNDFEGLYSCVAVFSNETMITSSEAALIFDRKYIIVHLLTIVLLATHVHEKF